MDPELFLPRLSRREPVLVPPEPGVLRASVALVLHAPPERGAAPELLFIRRAEHPLDPWSGQIAFPGGRQDPDDPDPEWTARRETLEEVGLELAPATGRLDDHDARGGRRRFPLVIAPFVYVVRERPELRLSEEVAETLWIPLPCLNDPAFACTHPLPGARHVGMPGVRVGGHVLWGMSLTILDGFLEAAGVPQRRRG